ncbi:MAG: sodium:solute symporter [Acidobacteria bacterium]|nr:sodium:solute symporter [Acidobacteriota bacterium]
MSTIALGWTAVVAYFLLTSALAYRSSRRTSSVATYAVGNRDIPAVVVGLSLAAQLTSVATFVVNPGLVYAYGYSALLGYGFCAAMGITLGLAFFSRRFRTHGARVRAVTVPQWIGTRYESTPLRTGFAVLSLGLITFATLIVVALSLVLSRLLVAPPEAVAAALMTIVVLGVMMGGATGHAWTNAVQASVMVVVAALLIGAGWPLLGAGGGITERLAAIDPNLVLATNPASLYFRNLFEVVVCNFVIGLAIVCQPHIISKALYLRDDREVRKYLATAIGVGLLFTGVLVTGIWARFALTQPVAIDRVISTWIASSFPAGVQVLITIGLLCAGLSTLEGILLALSATFSADFYPLFVRGGTDRAALRAGRAGLAMVAVTTVLLAIWQISHPTGGTVAIFAQYGVYLLFSASFLPLGCGMFLPRVGRSLVSAAVVAVVVTYVAVALLKLTTLHNNPAFLATAGIAVGWVVIGVGSLVGRLRST